MTRCTRGPRSEGNSHGLVQGPTEGWQNRRSGAWQREWAVSGRPGVSSMAKNTARWPRGHCIAQASTCDTAVASICTAASAAKSPSAPPSRISRWSVTAASERERSRAATGTTHCEAQEPATTVREHANGPRAAANENSDLHWGAASSRQSQVTRVSAPACFSCFGPNLTATEPFTARGRVKASATWAC